MPLYDYACTKCGRGFEVRHGVHEEGPQRCTHCGGRLRLLISTPTVHFKGSGWAKKERAEARSAAPSGRAARGEVKPATEPDGKASTAAESRPEGDPQAGPDKPAGPPVEGAAGATVGGRSDG